MKLWHVTRQECSIWRNNRRWEFSGHFKIQSVYYSQSWPVECKVPSAYTLMKHHRNKQIFVWICTFSSVHAFHCALISEFDRNVIARIRRNEMRTVNHPCMRVFGKHVDGNACGRAKWKVQGGRESAHSIVPPSFPGFRSVRGKCILLCVLRNLLFNLKWLYRASETNPRSRIDAKLHGLWNLFPTGAHA